MFREAIKQLQAIEFICWTIAFLLCAVGALVACTSKPYGDKLLTSCDKTNLHVTIHLVEDESHMVALYKQFKTPDLPDNSVLDGFATAGPEDNDADLYVMPLRGQSDSERMQTWGHELAHAVCGKWHPPGFAG